MSKLTLEDQRQLLVCPGDTILDEIEFVGMSQRELAERLGYPPGKLNQLIKGDVSVTPDMAGKLERVLGIPAGTWLGLEKQYQEDKLRIREQERIQGQHNWLTKFPIKKLVQLGVLTTKDKVERVNELLQFFRVASAAEWRHIYIEAPVSVAFKISLAQTPSPEALSVWLRYGELQADKLQVQAYDKKRFQRVVQDARQLAYRQPDDFMQRLQVVCAAAGVALVYTPCFPRAKVNGATRWIKNRSVPLMQISDRYKTADFFWFAFFHEAAHILKHGKTDVFLEGVQGVESVEEKEEEANSFASRILLNGFPIHQHTGFGQSFWDEDGIRDFSEQYQIHPGILVAQLQRVGSLGKQFLNRLKKRISFD